MLNMIYSEFKEVMIEIEKRVSKGRMFFSSYGIGELDLLPEELNKNINKETTSNIDFYVHREKDGRECCITVCEFESSKKMDVWLYVNTNNTVYVEVVAISDSNEIADFVRFEESVLNTTPIKAFQWAFDN